MEFGEIRIAFVSWKGGGKSRPVLIIKRNGGIVFVYKITSQSENKSPAIRTGYFPIRDWGLSGLEKPSYVDTSQIIALKSSSLSRSPSIGALTRNDEGALIAFLEKRSG
jgi:hypothetical protein